MTIVLDGTSGITSPNETTGVLTATSINASGAITAASVTTTGATGSLNSINTFGFKNRVINGNMAIDQRNAGAAVTLSNSAFVYGVDRWAGKTSTASSSTVTMQRVAIETNGFQYGLRILRGSGTYTGTATLIQEPESANTSDLAGQTITVSFWARKGSTSTAIPYIQLVGGTGTDQGISGANQGSWTGWLSIGASFYTPTTTLTQYTTTFNVPSNSTELALLFVTSSYSGTGSANDYIDITGIQLEKGSTATSFDQRAYSQELAMCQRYYQSLPAQGIAITTVAVSPTVQPVCTMRSTPTGTYSGSLRSTVDGTTRTATTPSVGVMAAGQIIFFNAASWSTALTVGVAYDGISGAIITLSSEL